MSHAYSCSHCPFTAQFESALKMHKQLHHDTKDSDSVLAKPAKLSPKKTTRVPSLYPIVKTNETKLLGRTSSATRLLDKLRARICRSRTLFSHPEENLDDTTITTNDPQVADASLRIEGSPEVARAEPSISRVADLPKVLEEKETFGCHLCSFDADRITVLDRHLLNHHKIGLENLLKLVMSKTKDGLSEGAQELSLYGIRRPYYKPPDNIIEEGEFVIETVTPKIKILKHAATNTDEIQWQDIPDLKNNCRMITAEIEKLINNPSEKCDKDEFLMKMQNLNECMCKFVDSSNTLKMILAKEYESKNSVRKHLSSDQALFDLCLGDNRNTSRVWTRTHSENMDRSRNKSDKRQQALSSQSYYF